MNIAAMSWIMNFAHIDNDIEPIICKRLLRNSRVAISTIDESYEDYTRCALNST